MSLKDNLLTAVQWAEKLAPVAETVASVFPLGASVVSAIKLAGQIVTGISEAEPTIEAAWADIQAAAAGGQPVTLEQWAAWQADVDQAHADFMSAAARVEAQP